MVLKTAEGISGIAEESRGLTCTPEQLASGGKPTLPSTDLCCPVTSHTVYLERWRVRR